MKQRWVPVPIHLLQKSNSKGGRDEVFASAEVSSDRANNIERSARDYARRWGWSPGRALRFLNDGTNFIDFTTLNSNGTDKAANNWALEHDTEQRQNRMLAKASRTETEQSLNINGTADAVNFGASLVLVEQERNTYGTETEQQYNKERNIENTSVLFEQFYSAYPKHKNRSAAEKAFKKLNPSAQLFTQIIDALVWQTKQPEWLKNNGQFIPLPASWLNGRRWEDERPESQAATNHHPQNPRQRLQVVL